MYARLNYVDMDPGRFDEIDAFWRGTVEGYEDLVCGYFLREGESSRTLSVVAFRSEAAMHANTARSLGEIVKQAAAMRLNEPELHPLEVCAEVAPKRPLTPACARVASVALKPERTAEFIAGWPQGMTAYLGAPGFGGGMMCCDRASGKTRSITFWGIARGSRSQRAKRGLREGGGPLPAHDADTSRVLVLGCAHRGPARRLSAFPAPPWRREHPARWHPRVVAVRAPERRWLPLPNSCMCGEPDAMIAARLAVRAVGGTIVRIPRLRV